MQLGQLFEQRPRGNEDRTIRNKKKREEAAEVQVVKLNADLQILQDDFHCEQNKINDFQQYGRRNMLELNNIPVR